MTTKTIQHNGYSIAVVHSEELILTDVQSALDLIATVRYETACDRMALNKEAISEDFFKLSSRLAGEILQKFVNYQMKLAIVGDFSAYTSKPLKDFIYESNRGGGVFFAGSEEQAVSMLASAK